MLSPVRMSVRLSVRRWYHRTVEVRTMKFLPYGSPMTFLRGKFHPEILRGSKGGVGKISSFLSLSLNISKTVADTAKVTIDD